MDAPSSGVPLSGLSPSGCSSVAASSTNISQKEPSETSFLDVEAKPSETLTLHHESSTPSRPSLPIQTESHSSTIVVDLCNEAQPTKKSKSATPPERQADQLASNNKDALQGFITEIGALLERAVRYSKTLGETKKDSSHAKAYQQEEQATLKDNPFLDDHYPKQNRAEGQAHSSRRDSKSQHLVSSSLLEPQKYQQPQQYHQPQKPRQRSLSLQQQQKQQQKLQSHQGAQISANHSSAVYPSAEGWVSAFERKSRLSLATLSDDDGLDELLSCTSSVALERREDSNEYKGIQRYATTDNSRTLMGQNIRPNFVDTTDNSRRDRTRRDSQVNPSPGEYTKAHQVGLEGGATNVGNNDTGTDNETLTNPYNSTRRRNLCCSGQASGSPAKARTGHPRRVKRTGQTLKRFMTSDCMQPKPFRNYGRLEKDSIADIDVEVQDSKQGGIPTPYQPPKWYQRRGYSRWYYPTFPYAKTGHLANTSTSNTLELYRRDRARDGSGKIV